MNTTMNTVNQTFNWSRFTAALRKEIIENNRALLFTILGTYGLLTMIMILGNLGGPDAGAEGMVEVYLPQKAVWFVLSFATMVIASLAFRKLTSKSGRIEMFTSPSSMLEKFLVNTLVYVLGYIVVFFICAQLADLTRIAVLWPFRDNNLIVPGPINFLTVIPDAVKGFGFGTATGGNASNWLSANMFVGLLGGPGLFLLGSILWPRLSLLKTFAAVYGIETVFGIALMIVISNINDMEAVGYWIMNHLEQIIIAMTILSVLLTVLYWAVAWFQFKRKDVVSLKWWK